MKKTDTLYKTIHKNMGFNESDEDIYIIHPELFMHRGMNIKSGCEKSGTFGYIGIAYSDRIYEGKLEDY